jgi:catechol 2,3-dioxygenase-like lactoylglutathione lyase family enzyme
MLDHIAIRVKDLEKSKAFYQKVLAVLGYSHNIGSKKESFYGFGLEEDPILEIFKPTQKRPLNRKIHIAFKAKNKEQVKEFYRIAMENGGIDNGKPGPRKNYTPTYYATFVIDPDGNNIEVCLY